MLSTAGRWERCSRALLRIQRQFGFRVFHATEFRALRGEFEGWRAEKRFDLLMAFGPLWETYLTECFTVSLAYETYKTHFLDRRPPKMPRTSQYGVCFMVILDYLMRTVMDHGRQSKLSVVVEDGHKNVGDTARLFADRKSRLDAAGIDILRSHELAKKACSPLLQLADISAHAHTHDKRAIKAGAVPDFSARPPQAPPPGKHGWTVSEITPEYLARIIEEHDSDSVAKHDAYLARRQVRLDGKVASVGAP